MEGRVFCSGGAYEGEMQAKCTALTIKWEEKGSGRNK